MHQSGGDQQLPLFYSLQPIPLEQPSRGPADSRPGDNFAALKRGVIPPLVSAGIE
jgi:hypothetical protein